MRPVFIIYPLLFTIFYGAILWWPSGTWSLVSDYGVFFFLGLAGALVANSTGAGGGVIFIPFFAAIGITESQSLATSMAIQCFGMTAGAFAWMGTIQKKPIEFACKLPVIQKMLLISGPFTIVGMLAGQYLFPKPNIEIAEIFRWFSVSFGLILFFYTLKNRKLVVEETHDLHTPGWIAIALTCLIGGVITSWISVGVGEIIALLLFFLGFSPALAVAVGVFTSAIAVLSGIVFHIMAGTILIEVLLFAGQAALIGGYLARHITQWLGSFRLKLFFAAWIFLTGLAIG